MTGYTRQSAGQIVNNTVIEASYFNNEYNLLQDTFDATTGHTHNGGVGEGARLPPTALSGVSADGFLARVSASTTTARTLTGTTNQITVTNGTGVSGDPTLTLPAAITAPGSLTTTTTLNAGTALTVGTTVATASGSTSAPSYSFTGDGNTGMYRSGADTLAFTTAGADRVTIGATGIVFTGQTTTTTPGVGVTTTGSALWPEGRLFLSGTAGSALNVQSTGSMLLLSYLGVSKGSISTDGSSIAYNTTSDYRLKDNVETLTDASHRVSLLKPKRFSFKADPDQVMVDGFIAHEVQEVVPQAVTGIKDGEVMQAMDASKLVPLLTAALQEALARIEILEGKVG
jgi:hypothetical protein